MKIRLGTVGPFGALLFALLLVTAPASAQSDPPDNGHGDRDLIRDQIRDQLQDGTCQDDPGDVLLRVVGTSGGRDPGHVVLLVDQTRERRDNQQTYRRQVQARAEYAWYFHPGPVAGLIVFRGI